MVQKFQSRISHSIFNEFTIQKLLHDLWATIYNIHNTIYQMAIIKTLTFLIAVAMPLRFRARDAETDVEYGCRRWMMIGTHLNSVRIHRFYQLLWKKAGFATVAISWWSSHGLMEQEYDSTCKKQSTPETAEEMKNSWWILKNCEEKFVRFWENFLLELFLLDDCEEWLWEKWLVNFCYGLRIYMEY